MLYFLSLILLLDFRNVPQVEASLRLVGSSDSCSGRVEVLYNGAWGTVCDDNWDAPDAAVVCRQLGCGNVVEAKSLAYFGVGSGTIWMDEVQCVGTENLLVNCPRTLWGESNCVHGEDAGVICQASVRLVSGSTPCSGRVEVLYNGVWGTVCDNGWDLSDAAVVCRELNCGDPVQVKTGAYYGQGTGKIWMDNAQCTGSETSLRNCFATKWDVLFCGHSKDAGVVCKPSIRVVNGPSSCSGRVEVLHGGVWGTVCSDSWNFNDAVSACKDLGCPYGAEAKRYSYFGPGVGTIWMSDTQCTGTELSLKQCRFSGWLNNNCDHSLDAGVICRNVRLANGGNMCTGRVEVLYNDQWGTVCDAGWDITDAAVLCQFLDCGIPVEAKTGAFFGPGSGPVWLDDVGCSGNELTVKDCPSKALGTSNCSHVQDAGVVCQDIKLVDGTTPCDGRVQIFFYGHWGSVCHTGWGLEEATVVCKALDCGAVVQPTAYAGPYNGPKWMDNLACTGNEGRLRNCPFTGYGVNSCGDGRYAGAVCKNVKLINGSHMCSGRVEAIYNYNWGTVCDAGWDLTDAAVVCNYMGCGTPVEVKTGAFFGQGSGPVWLDNVRCSGKETTLRNCPSKALGTSTCSHGQDAGVVCRDVKLVNGTSPCDGNILILNNAQWGAVCYNGWDLQDATVLCSELGCGEVPVPVPYVGTYNGPIWMDNLACTGKEWTVRDCPFTGYGVSSCVGGRYAGVTCIIFVRKNLLRITVTVETGIYVNDPIIKKSIMDKISKVVKSKGNFFASWKTQRDGKVFHQIPKNIR